MLNHELCKNCCRKNAFAGFKNDAEFDEVFEKRWNYGLVNCVSEGWFHFDKRATPPDSCLYILEQTLERCQHE